jgi:hypothetical protein
MSMSTSRPAGCRPHRLHPARRLALAGALGMLVCGLAAQAATAQTVFINPGMPGSSSGLQVEITPGQDQFTITNPQSNGAGNVITSMFGNLGTLALTRDGFQSAGPPTRPDGSTTAGPVGSCLVHTSALARTHGTFSSGEWKCDLTNQYAPNATGAILPGESETFTFAPYQGDEQNILPPDKWLFYITFNFANLPANCRPAISSSFASAFTSSALGVTADDCTVPSHTTVTKMRIDQRHRTADFHLTAKRAKSYQCELLRNGKVKYRHSCGAHKKYANALPRGKYLFLAWGVNHVGMDRTAAMLPFTIK